jgi:quinone-modifying oxidoreductase subunit QmoC
MAEAYRVSPDREFLQRMLDGGGADLKKCFQCATCTVACELSSGRAAFPRKEMVWAQWGLKDRLLADPDAWLCHQCNDCTTRCPRGARPGDVLAAVRKESVQHYAVPRFLSRWASSFAYLPVMLAIAAVLLVGALLVRKPAEESAPVWSVLRVADHHGFYADLFPHWLLIGFFSFFLGLALVAAVVGIVRFWRAMKAADRASGGYTPTRGILPSLGRTIGTIFSHSQFGKCLRHRQRRLAHLGVFYGFAALFLVSVWAVVALYIINPLSSHYFVYPFVLWNPWKILANLACIALILGCVKAIVDRKRSPEAAGVSTSFDWVFVWLLLGVGVTGLLTEIFRFVADPGVYGAEHTVWTGLQYAAYSIYFVHLMLVFDLLVYLPYSKFAHVLYRTAALVYGEHTGRSEEVTRAVFAEAEAQRQDEPRTEQVVGAV